MPTDTSPVINLDTATFDDATASGTAVVDFWAGWCGPCRTFAPTFARVADELADDKVRFAKVDVDANPDLARAYGVQSIPTLVVLRDGTPVAKISGVLSAAQLTDLVAQTR